MYSGCMIGDGVFDRENIDTCNSGEDPVLHYTYEFMPFLVQIVRLKLG